MGHGEWPGSNRPVAIHGATAPLYVWFISGWRLGGTDVLNSILAKLEEPFFAGPIANAVGRILGTREMGWQWCEERMLAGDWVGASFTRGGLGGITHTRWKVGWWADLRRRTVRNMVTRFGGKMVIRVPTTQFDIIPPEIPPAGVATAAGIRMRHRRVNRLRDTPNAWTEAGFRRHNRLTGVDPWFGL